jgi:hypothetical protein
MLRLRGERERWSRQSNFFFFLRKSGDHFRS